MGFNSAFKGLKIPTTKFGGSCRRTLYRGEGESVRNGDGRQGSTDDEKKNQARWKRRIVMRSQLRQNSTSYDSSTKKLHFMINKIFCPYFLNPKC